MNNVCEAVIATITLNGSASLPFVIPSGAEGSAVHSAFTTKVHGKNAELGSHTQTDDVGRGNDDQHAGP
jgi:hypothetical protein